MKEQWVVCPSPTPFPSMALPGYLKGEDAAWHCPSKNQKELSFKDKNSPLGLQAPSWMPSGRWSGWQISTTGALKTVFMLLILTLPSTFIDCPLPWAIFLISVSVFHRHFPGDLGVLTAGTELKTCPERRTATGKREEREHGCSGQWYQEGRVRGNETCEGVGSSKNAALLSGHLPKKNPHVLSINALSLLCVLWPIPLGSLCLLLTSGSGPWSAAEWVPPGKHCCQVIFGGCDPFYSDYAVLQLRLLNFSPFWSLIFTLLYIAHPGSWPRGLLAAPGKIKREINILEVKTVLKGQTLSSYKSVQQDSIQKSLYLFSIWPEKNSNNKTAATRWTRMIRSSPQSLRAGTSGYTECFVLWSVKL